MMGFLRPAISGMRGAALCVIAVALAQAPALAQMRQGLAPADSNPSFAPLPPAAPQIPDQQQLAPPQQAPSAGQQQPGVFEQWGRWWDQSITSMNQSVTNMNQSITNMNNSWKDTFKSNLTPSWPDTSKATSEAAADMAKGAAAAADAMGKLGTSRVIAGPAVCPLAPNGAPDCRSAAERLCKQHGYKTGSSVDYVTAEKCPAEVTIAGRRPVEGECPIEHSVTKALCQ
jgi:hypothetical protein